jgi:hypothetical protein
MDPQTQGILRTIVLPGAAGTTLEIALHEDGDPLVAVQLESVEPHPAISQVLTAQGRYPIDRRTEIVLWWGVTEQAAVYSLRVDGTTVVQAAPLQARSHVDSLSFSVLGDPAGAWRIREPVTFRGTGIVFDLVPEDARVRLVGLDEQVVATSVMMDPTQPHRHAVALPVTSESFPARFEIVRDGAVVGAASPIVFDIRPGDRYRVGTELQPSTRNLHRQFDFPRVAGFISLVAGLLAFLAVTPSITISSVAVGILAYVVARVLVVESLTGAGLPPSPMNRAVVALAFGAAIALPYAQRLWKRLGDARNVPSGTHSRRSILFWLTTAMVVAVIGLASTLAVAGIPTPEDAAQYAYVGGRWLQHAEVPFLDQYADKSPGLFLIYGLLGDLAGHGLYSLLITRLLVTSIIVLLGIWFAHRLGGRMSALCAGALLALVVSWIQFGGDAPRAAEIGLLPLLTAFALLHEGRSRQHPAADWLAGAFLGLAILTSAQTVYALPLAALWLWPDPCCTGTWKRTVRLATGSMTVIAAALFYFVAKGALEPMYVWWIERSVTHVDFWLRSHVLEAKPGLDFFVWVPTQYQPIYLAIGIMVLALVATKKWWAATVLVVAAITQHASIKPLYRFEEHDYMAFSLVLFLGVAFLAQSASWPPRMSWRGAIRVPGLVVAGVLVVGAVVPAQVEAHLSPPGNNFDREAPDMAAQIAQVTPGDRRLFVWNNSVQIPWLLDSPVAGGWNQTHSADNNPGVRREWVDAIEAELPHAIVTPRGLGDQAFRDVQSRLRYMSVESVADAYELYLRSPGDQTPTTPVELRHLTTGCQLVKQAESELHTVPVVAGPEVSTYKLRPGSVQTIHAYVQAKDGASPMTVSLGGATRQVLSLELHRNGDIYQGGTYITRAHDGFGNKVRLSIELIEFAGEQTYSLFVDGVLVDHGRIENHHVPVETATLFAAKHSSEWSVQFAPTMERVLGDWVIERTLPTSTVRESQTVAHQQFEVPVGRVLIELDAPVASAVTVAVGLEAGHQGEVTLSPVGGLAVPNMPEQILDLSDNERVRILLAVHEEGLNTVYDVFVNDVPVHKAVRPVRGQIPNRVVQISFHSGPLGFTPIYELVVTGRGGVTIRNAAPHDIVRLEHQPGAVVQAATTARNAESTTIKIPLAQVFEHGSLAVVDAINLNLLYRSHHINNLCPGDIYEFVRT